MSKISEYKIRVTWLLVGLGGSLLIARTINGFEEVLKENVTLAAFIPLIVYMSDAVGTQMESIIVRELKDKQSFDLMKFFRFQFAVTLPIAITIAIISIIAISLIYQDMRLGVVIGVSLIGSILSSLLTGVFMPYWFWRFHEDPAEASGPIATVIQDFLSVLAFFLIAQGIY